MWPPGRSVKRQGDSQASAARTGVPKPHLSTRVPQEEYIQYKCIRKATYMEQLWIQNRTDSLAVFSLPHNNNKKDTLYNNVGGW